MKTLRLFPLCGLALLLGVSGPVQAKLDLATAGSPSVGASRDSGRYEALMRLSGMGQEIDEVPGSVVRGITSQAQATGRMDFNAMAALQAQTAQAFNPIKFRARVLTYLQTMLSASDADAVIAWLQTPLGQELTALEVASSAPEAQQAMMQYATSAPPLTPAREKLLHDLDRASGNTDSMVRLNEVMALAMVQAMAATMPEKRDAMIKAARAQIESKRADVRAASEKQTLAMLAYIYRDVPDEKMAAYLRFNQTSAAQHFNSVSNDAYIQAIDTATRELFDGLIRQAPGRAPADTRPSR